MSDRILRLALAGVACLALAGGSICVAEDATAEVRASIERLVKNFDAGNAEALAGAFAVQGELIDEEGTLHQGRKELQELFAAFFQKFPGAKLMVEIESIRPLGDALAIEEGTRYIQTKDDKRAQLRYVNIHTKVKDEWQIASTREFSDDAPTPHDHLQQLAWLVGDWVNEGSDAVVRISYRWSEDKNYLLGEYAVVANGKPAMNSSQRIGWDASQQKIRSWLFDTDGGFSEGVWTAVEDGWMVKSQSVVADGRSGSATLSFLPKGKDHFLLIGADRIVGDEKAPDFEVAIARKPSVTSSGDANPGKAPAEKPAPAATPKPNTTPKKGA